MISSRCVWRWYGCEVSRQQLDSADWLFIVMLALFSYRDFTNESIHFSHDVTRALVAYRQLSQSRYYRSSLSPIITGITEGVIVLVKTLSRYSASLSRISQPEKGGTSLRCTRGTIHRVSPLASLGVMVMIRRDNRGLVLPRVIEIPFIIAPVGVTKKMTEEEELSLHEQCEALAMVLRAADVHAETDKRLFILQSGSSANGSKKTYSHVSKSDLVR